MRKRQYSTKIIDYIRRVMFMKGGQLAYNIWKIVKTDIAVRRRKKKKKIASGLSSSIFCQSRDQLTALAIIPLMNAFSTRHVFSCQMSRIRAVSSIRLIFLVVGMHASEKLSDSYITRIAATGKNVMTFCFFLTVTLLP